MMMKLGPVIWMFSKTRAPDWAISVLIAERTAGLTAPWMSLATGNPLPSAMTEPRMPVVFRRDRKSTRLNSSHVSMSYAVFCLVKNARHRPGPAGDGSDAVPDRFLDQDIHRGAVRDTRARRPARVGPSGARLPAGVPAARSGGH